MWTYLDSLNPDQANPQRRMLHLCRCKGLRDFDPSTFVEGCLFFATALTKISSSADMVHKHVHHRIPSSSAESEEGLRGALNEEQLAAWDTDWVYTSSTRL